MLTGCGGPPLLSPPQLLSSAKTAVISVPIIQRLGTRPGITPPRCDFFLPFPDNECAGHELDTSFAKQAFGRSGEGVGAGGANVLVANSDPRDSYTRWREVPRGRKSGD